MKEGRKTPFLKYHGNLFLFRQCAASIPNEGMGLHMILWIIASYSPKHVWLLDLFEVSYWFRMTGVNIFNNLDNRCVKLCLNLFSGYMSKTTGV